MGHYDSCRDGYCSTCGAAPGNHKNGICQVCHPRASKGKVVDQSKRLVPAIKTDLHSTAKSNRTQIELAAQRLEDLLNAHGGNLVVKVERVCESAIGGPIQCSHTIKIEMDWS